MSHLDPCEIEVQKTPDGYIQGYTAQLAVAERQIIVGQHVTAAATDVQEVPVLVQGVTRALRRRPRAVLADASYWSEANVALLERRGIDAYIATERYKHNQGLPPAPRGRPPAGLTARERMARKLRTVVGRKIYALRKTLAEPVLGQIKHARGFRQFLRRGLHRVSEE